MTGSAFRQDTPNGRRESPTMMLPSRLFPSRFLKSRFLLLAGLLSAMAAVAPAAAQDKPGDAAFCQRYASAAATAAQDAIALNPACLDPGKGVHPVRQAHAEWCARTPSQEVEGAATHILRLASRCTKGALAMPTDYGGFDIVGANQKFEKPYGVARDWDIRAASSGKTFLYCVAVSKQDGHEIRIGYDTTLLEGSGQWQVAVPVPSKKDWQGTFEVDGKGLGNGGGSQIGGTAFPGWTIAWLSAGDVDGLRKGKNAVLGTGKQDVAFGLEGVAAALLKVEACRARKGAGATATAAAAAPAARSEATDRPFAASCPERLRTLAATPADPGRIAGFVPVVGSPTGSQSWLQDIAIHAGSADAGALLAGKAEGRNKIAWSFDGTTELFATCLYEGGIRLTRPLGSPKTCTAAIRRSRDPGSEGGWGLEKASLRCN